MGDRVTSPGLRPPDGALEDQHPCGATAFAAFPPGGVEGSLQGRFASVAAAHRGCLAVADGARRVTYGELDDLTARIATQVVRRLGAGWEPVALVLRQGLTSIAATLGILRAGKAFVPLDPSDPPARLSELLDQVGARLVLVDRSTGPLAAALAASRREVLVVDDPPPPAGRRGDLDVAPEAIACIFFTSGSTGGPKGVADTHRNVLHNVRRYTDALRIAPGDRLSLLQSPSFSGAVSSTFGALLNGAALVPFDLRGDRLAELAATVRSERVTIYHSVPAIFRSLMAVGGGAFPHVRVVRLEGDRASSFDAELARRNFGPRTILANGLGTTETGLCRQLRLSAAEPVAPGPLPVGHALPDVDVAVVDDLGRTLPLGDAGEIVVRSRYLAPGYWRRPDLTRAAFGIDEEDPSRRTYRTGDLGRLRPDGCLEYLGRRDGRLKVLGQRVEPAEVEAGLLEVPGVLEAAVSIVPGRRDEGRLVAHLVLAPGAPDLPGLRAAAAARLPAHAVPSRLEVVDVLPLAPNGKVDRRSLAPRPEPAVPRRADEARLLHLWRQVLERDDFGVDDDFFELGGDSLAAAEVLAALEADAGEELVPSLLLRAPTVARLAEALRAPDGGRDAPPIVVLQPRGGGPPLVLVDPEVGGSNVYGGLVRRLGAARPVWRLDPPRGELSSVAALAAGHVATLTEASPEGPYLLGGFCFGAVVALEMARRLRAEGRDVRHLALVGVSPYDLPSLVAPEAMARYLAVRRPVPRVRAYLAEGGMYAGARRLRHYRDGLLILARGAGHAVTAPARRGPSSGAAAWLESRIDAMRRYAPARLAGGGTLYLSAGETARYSDDPASDWAGVSEDTRVRIFPGSHADLLREPAVSELATRINRDIEASLA